MKFFKELKLRCFFILLSFIKCFIISYFYKDILYFILIANLNFFKKDFYFVYTNVLEIFIIYFKLVEFITVQVLSYYLIFHVFNFFVPAFYRVEYFCIKSLFISVMFFLLVSCVLHNFYVFPLLFCFFNSFQSLFNTNLIFFEIKVYEYVLLYVNFFNLFFFSLISLNFSFLGLKYFNLQKSFLVKVRKLAYFIFILNLTFWMSFLDIILQILFILVFIILFELFLFFKTIILKNDLIQ